VTTAPVVQRDTAGSPEDTRGVGEKTEETEEINIDALARQVYQQIKRRIAVEWERGRRKW
jgi:hypothetical protein